MRRSQWLAITCGGLAVAILATVVAPRLLTGPARPSHPSASAPARGLSFECRLPVLAGNGTHGIINTRTGLFTYDSGTASLPSDLQDYFSFDASYALWVPEPANQVSPDGRAYVYASPLQEYGYLGLWIYDIGDRDNRFLGEYIGAGRLLGWQSDGIHIAGLDLPDERVIDPATGKVVRELGIMHYQQPFTSLSGDPVVTYGEMYFPIGTTADGHPIIWIANRDEPRGPDWVFYETAPGERVYIYKGMIGDALDFQPMTAIADRSGIWFSALDRVSWMWHWDPRTAALTGLNVTGPSGRYVPAGACL